MSQGELFEFDDCFKTGRIGYYNRDNFEDRCKAVTVALSGWESATGSGRRPDNFGRAMFLLGQIVGEPLTQKNIIRVGQEYAAERNRRLEKTSLNKEGFVKRKLKVNKDDFVI